MAKELNMLNKSLQENLDLTAYSQAGHTHKYAGSDTVGGAASTAVKLHTARKINGTNFDGSGDITTANWGTARNITIGSSSKSVNGSGNVGWTLAEIGAAPTVHNHTFIESIDTRSTNPAPNTYTSRGITPEFKSASGIGLPNVGKNFAGVLTYQQWSDTSAWSGGKTTQFATIDDGRMYYRKGDGSGWGSWYQFYTTQNKPTYSDVGAAAASHGTHVTYATATPSANGTAAVGSSAKVAREDHVHPLQTTISGAAGSAGKWTSARTLTIGNSGKSVDGSANVTWTLAEIGALPLSGGTMTGAITTPNNAQGIKVGDDAVICDRNIANHIVIEGATATSGGITFGSGKDTNIYRGGTNLLKTDDTFNAVGGLQWNGESLDTRYAKASHGSHISFSTTTPKVAGTAAIGSDSGAARGDHVHPAQTSVSGNAGTATKLQTARTIALGTGVTSTATSFDGSKNITIPVTGVKEAYLEWGGRNFSGGFGPIDAAMVPHLGANRLAFMPAAGVAFEYSRDGGSTWTAYSTSNANKINFFNGNGADHFIGADSSTKKDKAKYMFRVTITASTAKVYTVLNKFVIYCSTNGSSGCYCSIDGRTQANVTAGTNTWVNFANKVGISGWSGYNVINTSGITVGTNSTQYGQLRFTFGVTSHANTVEYPGLSVSMIMGFGGVGWGTPSTMAAKGCIYNYDENQNVTFPAQVTATQFNGPLNGNASTATKWSSARTLTIGNSGKTYDGSGNQSYSLSEIGALPTAGGTMTGNIKFADVTSTTYPAKSAMLTWNGSTDGADIYYQVDASDKGRLVLNTRDDADCIIMFANNGTSKATIDNSGNFSGKAAKAGNADTATKLATARTITIGNQSQSFDGTGNISFSVASIGASASGHTHKYAGSSSAGGAANSVANNLIVKLNGGSTEGTNLFTFNGSGAKTINITPSAIGAAASNHGTHVTYSTAAPKVAGTAAVGSANNVARGDHVHPAQTSVTGNAGTATKLQNAKSITIGNKANTFDGSANISYTLAEIGAAASSHSHNTLSIKGTDTITSTTNDTTAKWGAQGTSVHWYTKTGQLTDQPSQWGYLLNIGQSSEVHQLWMTQSSGDLKHRGGNGSGWSGTWRTILDDSNYKTYVTPANIGAAAASHGTHVDYATATPKAHGTAAVGTSAKVAREDHVHPAQTSVSGNAGTATKLQTARTITIGNKSNTFDGNANISYTLADIGAATSGHTHNYAGSSSAGGAANSAVKLSSARTINGTNFDGTANITTANWGTARKINQISVNGSADVKLPLDYYTCNIGASNAKPYHHILTTGQCTGSWTDKSITIVITQHYNGGGLGIARATLRTNDAANGDTASGELKWLVRLGFNEDQLCYNLKNTAKDAYMDVFFKCNGTYGSTTWYVLTEGVRGSHSSQWTKQNTHHDNGTHVYDKTGMKAIRTYTSTLVAAEDAGFAERSNNAYYADDAGTAATLKTARTITIGNKSNSFDGSANISYTLADIGALATSGGTMSGNITLNNGKGIYGKTGEALKDSEGATVAAGSSGGLLVYNTSHNLHLGAIIYDKKLVTGSTYINGATNMFVRTNKGYVAMQPERTSTMTFYKTYSNTNVPLRSSVATGTYLAGNQGTALLNSTASAGDYTTLIKSNSTNGYFTLNSYRQGMLLSYTAKSTVDAGTNAVTKTVKLIDESGNTSFPGTVAASAFSGNASTATKLQTARNIKIGNATKSFNGTANVEFTLAEIGIGNSISAVASNLSGVTINGYDSMMTTINSNLGKL